MVWNIRLLFIQSLLSKGMLEYAMGPLDLGWRYNLLVLELIRDKGRLLRGQVSLTQESNKPLYTRRGDVST